MSENIPESIPTSSDPRTTRPIKKRALTPRTEQAAHVSSLFKKPDREIRIPPADSSSKRTLAPPPEIVTNVQGSSAGAGSGEFHVYKASRRREYERLRLMDEEVKKEEGEKEFLAKKEAREKADRERTEKNRAKRERKMKAKAEAARKAKMAKEKKGDDASDDAKEKTKEKVEGAASKDGEVKKKLTPLIPAPKSKDDEDEEVPGGGEVKNAEEIGLVIEDDDD